MQKLPPVRVIGQNCVYLPVIGFGSATIVSDPIIPRRINGHSYILLDMGREPQLIEYSRSGLMRLFGTDIPLDPRYLVSFVEMLKVEGTGQGLTDQSSLTRSQLSSEPTKHVYSGFFEDGWMSEDVSVTLDVPKKCALDLKFTVPEIKSNTFYRQVDRLEINGRAAGQYSFSPGKQNIQRLIAPGIVHIGLTSARAQTLPGLDGRLVSGYFDRVGCL
jgi:hypothetical protein